jgi:hypothetical protein
MVMTMSTILSSDSSIISFIQMKHTSTQHRRLKAESFESKEHEMIQRILKRGHRLRVYGFTSLLRLVGEGKHLSYGSTIISKTLLSVLLCLRSLVGA